MSPDVDPAAAVEANRLNWDQRAPIHAASRTYDLDGLVSDPTRITHVVTEDLRILLPHLPDHSIEGLDVVHLQCHIGTDTLSLARKGGRIVGVDFSPRSLEVARDLAARAGADIEFFESEVTGAAAAIGRQFDLVYTSIGTITWLPDLEAWASTIAALLRPGGIFYIRDGHPMMYALDMERTDELVVALRYFEDGTPVAWDDATTYTDGDTSGITNTRTYEYPHPIAEVLGSVLGAELQLVHFGEYTTLPWKGTEMMEEDGDGDFVLPAPFRDRVPLAFSLVARKPG